MANASRTGTKTAKGLHVCPSCASTLVQPVAWKQAGDRGHWRLWRRCPECEWRHSGVFGEREIDRYDEVLDGGTETLAKNLKELERQNMEWVVDAFVTALSEDLISADDFA